MSHSKHYYLLDSGHGGLDENGNYVTAPSKMYEYDDFTIYEGHFNRRVKSVLRELLHENNFDYVDITPGYTDIALSERVKNANIIHEKCGNAIYISIHGNAGGGTGFEVYTSKGETKSDKIAELWIDEMEKIFPGQANRGEKDRNFYVLRKTKCPAILTESFFMDTRKDAEIMMSDEGVYKVARGHLNMIKRLECI